MGIYASWVHGNAAKLQYPGGAGLEFADGSRMDQVAGHAWTDLTGLASGPGMSFVGNGDDQNWFHFPLPTPVLVGDAPDRNRAKVLRVFALFNAEQFVEVDNVSAFDGPTAIPLEESSPSGNTGQLDGSLGLADLQLGRTMFPVSGGGHEMLWGLGISVHVSFGRHAKITFTAAGADFEIPDL